MKTNKITRRAISGFIFGMLYTPIIFASTTAGGAIESELEITSILQQIIDFLTGPIAMLLIVVGIIVGGTMVAVSKQNDSTGWNRIGKVIMGATIIFGAIGIVNLFFSGAVI